MRFLFFAMSSFRFKKEERLSSRKLINELFVKGNRVVTQFPFRILWKFTAMENRPYPAQVMISVPKKSFPRAVDRNRVKRQIRELYRLSKHKLYDALDARQRQIILSVSYQGKEQHKTGELSAAYDQVLARLIRQISGQAEAGKT